MGTRSGSWASAHTPFYRGVDNVSKENTTSTWGRGREQWSDAAGPVLLVSGKAPVSVCCCSCILRRVNKSNHTYAQFYVTHILL